MGVDQVVVLAVVLSVLMMFFALSVEYMVPMFQKIKFDQICRDYLIRSEANNGLTYKQIAELKNRLEESGLREVQIRFSEKDEVARREIMTFSVRALYTMYGIVDLFRRDTRVLHFHFERDFYARRIVE